MVNWLRSHPEWVMSSIQKAWRLKPCPAISPLHEGIRIDGSGIHHYADITSYGGGSYVKQWRERYPYEWCIAVSGAVALAISPWAPSIPFSELFTTWSRWIGEPLLGWSLVAPYDEAIASFLPLFGAAVLGYPLLTLCSRVLDASKSLVWVVRTAVALMLFLAGTTAVDAVTDLGPWYVFSQIAVGCAIGILLAVFGGQLYVKRALPSRIRLFGAFLFAAGVCIATFVLLPAGLLVLCVAHILLTIILASRQTVHTPRAGRG